MIPTLLARVGDEVYLHGSAASRALRALGAGLEVCLEVTLVDGIVLARSAFHHSINYRSVVLYGTARPVDTSRGEGARRWRRSPSGSCPAAGPTSAGRPRRSSRRPPCSRCRSTEGSAKVRTGPPIDDDEDYALDAWAGVVPLRRQELPPEPDPRLREGIALPQYLQAF